MRSKRQVCYNNALKCSQILSYLRASFFPDRNYTIFKLNQGFRGEAADKQAFSGAQLPFSAAQAFTVRSAVLCQNNLSHARIGVLYADWVLQFFLINPHTFSSFPKPKGLLTTATALCWQMPEAVSGPYFFSYSPRRVRPCAVASLNRLKARMQFGCVFRYK